MNTPQSSQSNDMLAKLLAHENINIVRSNVRTASFDIKNRVLMLPQWKDMSKDAEQMLIGHEVGHALFTSMEKYGKVFEKENSHLRGYANIIEDARIESMMKDRYPGLRKTFIDGYKYLSSKDFFGLKGRDMHKLILIDRINLYFKLGYNCGISFSQEESVFVSRVEKCKSETDVLELASEIYEYSKKKSEEIQTELDDILAKNKDADGDESSEYEYDDGDYDDDLDTEAGEDAAGASRTRQSGYGDVKDGVDPDPQPETLNNLEKTLAEYADTNTMFKYFDPVFEESYEKYHPVIINYSRVLSELKGKIEAKEAISKKQVDDFKLSTSGMVNYLIKEFEMKKSASAYKRAKLSKLGQLNVNKLYAYQLKDDIFKQVMTVKDGKKHGMVFLLDWSGSMSNNINETVEQLINLAMFCQKAQIPYRVFAFTDGYKDDYRSFNGMSTINPNGLGKDYNFNLLELFSNKMTNAEFNSMISLMLNRPWRFKHYGLNGTPLEEATLYMVGYLQKFKAENKVEKLSFITLTDGEGGELYSQTGRATDGYTYEDGSRKTVKAFLRDPITKKEYPMGDCANTQMIAIRKLITDRLDARIIGFYIVSKNTREIERFYKNNSVYSNQSELAQKVVSTQEKLKKEKYDIIEMQGYNEFYLLTTTKIYESDLDDVNSNMSAAAISRNLSKMMNSRKVSRVVLDRFITNVS